MLLTLCQIRASSHITWLELKGSTSGCQNSLQISEFLVRFLLINFTNIRFWMSDASWDNEKEISRIWEIDEKPKWFKTETRSCGTNGSATNLRNFMGQTSHTVLPSISSIWTSTCCWWIDSYWGCSMKNTSQTWKQAFCFVVVRYRRLGSEYLLHTG